MSNPDSDDFGDSDDDLLVLAATQLENLHGIDEFDVSPRPAKRARLQERQTVDICHALDGQDDREDVSWYGSANSVRKEAEEANTTPTLENSESEAKSSKRSRYRIHEPSRDIDLAGQVFTQTQPPQSSQPWMIRGPIWKKARLPESTSKPFSQQPFQLSEREANVQATVDRAKEISNSNIQDDVYEVADSEKDHARNIQRELEDLPSDAFISSSPNETMRNSRPADHNFRAPLNGLRQTTLFGRDRVAVPPSQADKRHAWPLANKDEPKTHHELDSTSTETWVYPTNIGKVRDYQFNIVARGLFHNLLVALPTGLGKTFIAATIMLNWYRWTKSAQIVFVAPTKPLVAQQVGACFHIAGIPWSDTSMLTGEVSAAVRAEEWQTKRVFFLTPQTLVNDLKTGSADPKRIVLVVVDEAHRATGGYAYVEVVKFIRRFNESFRVLALTATPGADVEAVQKVIDGLDISRVEIRTEHSLDIREYVHQRQVEKMVFQNSDEMVMLMDLYAKAVQPVLNVIIGMNAFWQRDPISLTPYGCTRALSQWMASDAGRHANTGVKAMVRSVFTNLASISHSMELLKYHGIAPFYKCLVNFQQEGDTSKSKYKKQIIESEHFKTMTGRLKVWVNNPEFIGHPKLEALREIILNHLMDSGEGLRNNGNARESNTRIMVFAHFRDSAEDVARILARDSPLIRPHVFVGQASAKNSEGMTQKKQLSVIEDFKSGALNTLIATSIGEEGLDIGEVDLIICYDSKSSPLRMLQRMGRTGRKRAGKIILFQMQGKEEDDAAKAKDSYEKMQELIARGEKFTFHEDRSRRILPREFQPEPDRREVVIPFENTQHRADSLPMPTKKGKGRAAKRPPKKFHMPDGVQTGFAMASGLENQRFATKIDEPVVIPALNDVLLDPGSMQDLTRRYQLTNVETEQDDNSEHTRRLPRLTTQESLGRTKAIPHGRASKSLVGVLRRTRKIDNSVVQELRAYFDDEYLYPEDKASILVDSNDQHHQEPHRALPATKTRSAASIRPSTKGRKIPSKKSVVEACEAPSSSILGTSPAMRLARSQAITLGSMDTPPPSSIEHRDSFDERDSDLIDFIADDDEEIPEESSSVASIDILQTISSGRISAISEDLPDLGNILRSRSSNEVQSNYVKESISNQKRRRCIVSSDEEDSDE